jgi:DNA-binding transcriptional MerR regulator
MLDVKTVSQLTGLTPRQVYDRLEGLSPVLDGHVMTGRHGRKLMDDYAFKLLQRLLELEKDGLSREAAINLIQEELDSDDQNAIDASSKVGEAVRILIEELRERIREQAKIIDWQQQEITRLQDLLHRQLPPPRRRWWWPWSGRG